MAWFGRRRGPRPEVVKRISETVLLDGVRVAVHYRIDCLGAVCPRPQLLTLKALDRMAPGEVLELLVDNPSSAEAIPALDMALGCRCLTTRRDADGWRIYVRKAGDDD